MTVKNQFVLKQLALRLDELSKYVRNIGESDSSAEAPGLLELARDELSARRDREKALPADLFAEPAWDLLVDLFIHHLQGKRVSTTSACLAASCPTTTALRYIDVLLERGLVVRHPSKADGRIKFVELSASGVRQLTEHFERRRKSARLSAFPRLGQSSRKRAS